MVKGYLVAASKYLEEKQVQEEQKAAEELKIKYFDVVPELSGMHEGKYIEETKSFNAAIEKYFKNFDRSSEEHKNYEEIAWKKFENIKVGDCLL